MTDSRKDLPPVANSNYMERLRETVQTYLGRQGSPLDRGLTLRDLADAGIIKLRAGFLTGTRGIDPVEGVGSVIPEPYEVDLTPPPTPTGLLVTAGITKLVLQWDPPIYTQGHGHDRTIIYGATYSGTGPVPTFANAVEISQALGAVTDYATNPATEWHIWIKWKSKDGVLSAAPAGGTNGFTVTTGQDVSLLLTALTSQLTSNQLAASLGNRINLIDGPSTTPGTVDARIATETTARTAGDAANASSITTLQARVATRPNLIPNASFENGMVGWTTSFSQVGLVNTYPAYGPCALWFPATPFTGTGVIQTTQFDISGGFTHVLAGDSYLVGDPGCFCYFDVIGLDASGNAVYDSPQNQISNTHSFATTDANRLAHAVEVTPPASAVKLIVRFIFFGSNITLAGCRQLKLEFGNLPATPYTSEVTQQGLAASITTETSVRATQTGYLGAQYTLRLDVGGVVGGYGISGTSSPGAGATIDFGIRANKFFIMPPAGVSNVGSAAFVYQATPTTINGVAVPAGLYLSDAFIENGTISNAKIGNAAIDTAKISDAAISTAKIGDAQITTAKIADAQVTTAKISDANITTAKIADANVTTAKIANLAVTGAQIADATVGTAKIADLSVSTLKIADNAVTVPLSARATGLSVTHDVSSGLYDDQLATGVGTFPSGASVAIVFTARYTVTGGVGSPAEPLEFVAYALKSTGGTTVEAAAETFLVSNLAPCTATTMLTLTSAGDWSFWIKARKQNADTTVNAGVATIVVIGAKK